MNQWICRFGVPRRIHTDQGRDFESNLIYEMCHLLDIEKTRTCPYRPQSDGMVERFNWTLTQMLATFAKGHGGDWDEHLPFFMLAYRSTVHESTGCTLNQMVFGREVTLPVNLMFGSPPQAIGLPACPVIYVEWLKAAMENSFEHARQNLRKTIKLRSLYSKLEIGCIDIICQIQLSRRSKPKVVHADDLKMCPVNPDSEDQPRNWLTEFEAIGKAQ